MNISWKKQDLFLNTNHLAILLCLTAFSIAWFTYEEYGISWDEVTQKEIGDINYNYLILNDNSLWDFKDRDYGPFYEVSLIFIEKGLGLTDSRDIFLMRHIVNHLFFLIGCYFIFLIINYLYKNPILATIGLLFLLLNPRLYAHSFYNTKDIPFMILLIIWTYYLLKTLNNKTSLRFIGLGICTGLLINFRIMGLLMFFMVVVILIFDGINLKEIKHHTKWLSLFIIFSCLSLYLTWPLLWQNPIENFMMVFSNMAKYKWGGTVLLNGEFLDALNLEWFYIPLWFSITTPIVYLLCCAIGILAIVETLKKSPLKFMENSLERNNLLFLGLFFIPVITVIILKSVLYDGWRHMFFIYPPFILICISGINWLMKKGIKLKASMLLAIFLTFVITARAMIGCYPLQGVYFNELFTFSKPEYLRKNFEMDYWGLSYKQSLEYILQNDKSAKIKVSVANLPGIHNQLILPSECRERINFCPPDSATYLVTNFRWHPKDYTELNRYKYHSIIAQNNTINQIFKID